MTGAVIVSVGGTVLSMAEKELLAHPQVGGVVLYRENWDPSAPEPKESLKRLIQEIRAIQSHLLIMVDHEGGYVWRFDEGFTKIPSAKSIGALYAENPEKGLELAFFSGFTMASELLDCGIDMSLAPVLDLDGQSQVIGRWERAFSEDSHVVALLGEQFIKGMHAAGMAVTAKHFPGHGSCFLDSHFVQPIDDRPFELLKEDLYPFETLIGKDLIEVIMPAHVLYPAFDPLEPAGFSSLWIEEYLRHQLGFNGVVISDCLAMEGANIGSIAERLQKAQAAGCDFLLYTHQTGERLQELFLALDTLPKDVEAMERRDYFVENVVHHIEVV